MFDLTGKCALVTGASGGIGGAVALALHKAGAVVTVSGTRIAPLEALAAEMGDRDWHALLDAHDAVVRAQLNRFRGREVNTSGDGFLAIDRSGQVRVEKRDQLLVAFRCVHRSRGRPGSSTCRVPAFAAELRGLAFLFAVLPAIFFAAISSSGSSRSAIVAPVLRS